MGVNVPGRLAIASFWVGTAVASPGGECRRAFRCTADIGQLSTDKGTVHIRSTDTRLRNARSDRPGSVDTGTDSQSQDGRTAFIARNAWLDARRISVEASAATNRGACCDEVCDESQSTAVGAASWIGGRPLSLVMIYSEAMRCPTAVLFDHGLIEQVGDICCLTDFGKRLAIYCRRFHPEASASISDVDSSSLRDVPFFSMFRRRAAFDEHRPHGMQGPGHVALGPTVAPLTSSCLDAKAKTPAYALLLREIPTPEPPLR